MGTTVQRRKRVRWGLCALAIVLLVGHIAFWYWSRPRPVNPSSSALAALVLSSDGTLGAEGYPVGLWLPYPHQNLGAVSEHWGDLPSLAADLALLADESPPRWLRFGPFVVPPARELAVLVNPEGDRAMAAARVYPLIALVARAAGGLAGNPWLSGGVIDSTEGRIEVRWKGATWQAAMFPLGASEPSFPDLASQGSSSRSSSPPFVEDGPPLVAALRLDDQLDLLPQGVYGIHRDQEAWVLARGDVAGEGKEKRGVKEKSHERSTEALQALDELLVGDVSLVAVGQESQGQSTSRVGRGLMLFSGSEDGLSPSGFALVNARPARRFPLAGLGVAALLGAEGHSGRASGWYVLASGERNFLRSAFMVSDLVRLTNTWESDPGPQIRWAIVARPAGVLEVLDDVAQALLELGPGMESEYRRTAALARLLRPLSSSPRATLILSRPPGRTELRVAVSR